MARFGSASFKHVLLLSAALTGAAFTGAQAQDTSNLEEIIVTAQRRGENLQSVPIAVSAITAETANRLGLTDTGAITQAVPGLTLTRTTSAAAVFLRGVGSGVTVMGAEPSVALYVDEIYVPSGAGALFDFNNIERVEVLKGPQGTLFGRNATGGVIHVQTKDPVHTTTYDANVSYGSFETIGAQFYGSTGLTDTLAANIAGYYTHMGKGWGTNLSNGQDVFKSKGGAVRGKLLWEPTDRTSALLSGSYEKRHGALGIAGRPVPGSFGINGYNPSATGVGFYDTNNARANAEETKFGQGSLKIRHDLEVAKFVSITSFTTLAGDSDYDLDASPTAFFDARVSQRELTYTQELQLLSPDSSPISWVIGGFYFNDKATYNGDYRGSVFGAAGRQAQYGVQKTWSYSGFGQATAEIMPRTNMTIGVRYTKDKRDFVGGGVLGPALPNPVFDQSSQSNLTGRFALDYHFTDQVLGYVSYNRGYKSGLFNPAGVSAGATTAPPAVAPEELSAYSVGFKSQFADNRVRLNAEAYYYDYTNIQVTTTVTGRSLLTNAGSATIKGVDVDATFAPTSALTITAAVSLIDGQYDKFANGLAFFPLPPNAQAVPKLVSCATFPPYPTGTGPVAQITCDLSGNDTIQTPKFTSNLSASYRWNVGGMPLDLAASWAHRGSYYFDTDNNNLSRQKSTDLINGSLTLATSDENFSVRLWVKNLTREKYYTYATVSTTSGAKYAPAAPRTIGVTLRAQR